MINLKDTLIREGFIVRDYGLKFNPSLAASSSAIEYIIVHHDMWPGATMENIHKDHLNKGWRGTGYHFRVRLNGDVELGRLIGAVGSHCSEENMNFRSIGVVFEGCYTDYPGILTTKDMPIIQYKSGIKLLKLLMDTMKIPYQNVRPHNYYAKKDCPGKYFPLATLLGDLNKKPEAPPKEEIELIYETLNKLGIVTEQRFNEPITRGEAMKMVYDALVYMKAIEPLQSSAPVIDLKKPAYTLEGTTHVLRLDPLSLWIQLENKPGNEIIGNFSSGTFQGHWQGKFISIGTLVSKGVLLAKQLEHDPARGHLVVYKDGKVGIEMIKDIEKERDLSKIWFAISGFNMEWGGMTSADYLSKVEWFPQDVARNTVRSVMGYNPKENKVIIAHRPDTTVDRGQLTLRNLGCVDDSGKILGICLDSGMTVNGNFEGNKTFSSDRVLHHSIRWDAK